MIQVNTVVQQVELPLYSSRVPGLNLSSGYCLVGVSHVLPMGFLPTPKSMQLIGLGTLNCPYV